MGRNYFVPPWACETPEINSNSHITEPIVKTFLSLPREWKLRQFSILELSRNIAREKSMEKKTEVKWKEI